MSGSGERTIKEWMDGFQRLYGSVDKRRTPEQIWIATMAHCSTIGESIRRFHFKNLATSCAHTFCWICSFVNRCNTADDYPVFQLDGFLSDWVSTKYPGCCGHCTDSPCSCKPKEMDEKEDKVGRFHALRKMKSEHADWNDFTVSTWQEVFDRTFSQRVHVQSLESVGFHLLEEVGECARAVRALSQLRLSEGIEGLERSFIEELASCDSLLDYYEKYEFGIGAPRPGEDGFTEYFTSEEVEVVRSRIVHAKYDMVAEMADTFSWFCSTLNKVSQIASNIPKELPTLDKHLESIYLSEGELVCPTCKEEECRCFFCF